MNIQVVKFAEKVALSYLVLVLVSWFLVCHICFGKMVKYNLAEMVSDSEIIVLGRVSRISKTNDNNKTHGNSCLVNITIEQIIKGPSTLKNCTVYFFNTRESLRLSKNEKAIFFVKKWKGINIFVQGFAGKLTVEKETVDIQYIRNEERKQNLEIFINKIKSLL